MKIGFDAKRLFHNNTGLGNYSRDLVRILKKYYPTNQYFLYNPNPKLIPYFSDSKQDFQIITPKGIWKKLHFVWRSFIIAKEKGISELDIYHGLSGELPLGLPNTLKKVVTIHDLIFMRYPKLYSFFDRKMHLKKFKYAADNADIIVAISEQTKKDIIHYLKIEPQKIKVIYQGCSEVFKQSYSKSELQKTVEKFNLPTQFVLNVGTIEERKNALTIVKAIKDIDTKLVIIGRKTKYADSIEKYILENNMQEKVIFLQGVSLTELAHIYQLATIFIYPSIFEGFGIPIIEALFSSTPVITSNSGVFPEAGGPNSIYIDETSVFEMTKNIKMLLENPNLRENIAKKGKDYVQLFSDDQIALQWNETYKKLL